MLRFGPAGNGDRFYAEGKKRSQEAPAWLHAQGLDAYEYSFGRGVSLREATAEEIGEAARRHGVLVSCHAPYYVNLADPSPERRAKDLDYLVRCADLVRRMGGTRVVVHAGAQQTRPREEALKNCLAGLREACDALETRGMGSVRICPETMGKAPQIGNLRETLALCAAEERLVPCVDFAHLHALGGGCLDGRAAMARVLDEAEAALGAARARAMHIHFSTIEFTEKGEKRHRTFAEAEYGPRFSDLAPELAKRGYGGEVICECSGTQAEDAAAMRALYLSEMEKAGG